MNPGELSQLQAAIADALARYGEAVMTYILQRPEVGDATRLAEPELQSIAIDPNVIEPIAGGVKDGGGQAEATTGIVWGGRHQAAMDYAQQRAAEMVGMRRRRSDGRLIPNPNAKWSVPQSTRDELQRIITNILGDGGDQADLKALIEPHFDGLFGEYRAEMIARTELAMAQNLGVVEGYKQGGVEYVRVLDNPECKICGPFADTIQTLQWASENPVGHPHCLPGDTLVFAPHATVGYTRAYSGDLVTIQTAQGRNLSATPNHPVLTARGWIAMGALYESDQLFCLDRSLFDAAGAVLGCKTQDNREALIRDIAQSRRLGRLHVARLSGNGFHGDGADGEVYAVRANSMLLDDREVECPHGFRQQIFRRGSVKQQSLPDIRADHLHFRGVDLSAPRKLSGSSNVGVLTRAESVRGRLAADINACSCQPFTNGPIVASHRLGDRSCRFAGLIARDYVSHVERKSFSGHVYNLSSTNGWYVSNTIITHNCIRAFNSATIERDAGGGAMGAGAAAGGISTATGLTGYNLEGQHDDCKDKDCDHESHKR